MRIRPNLEGLLAWRSGYATGLYTALELLRSCKHPSARVQREIRHAVHELRRLSRQVDTRDKRD